MFDSLRGLNAYVICSRLFRRPLSGHDGSVESDMTRLKRGVRYVGNLNWHEAYFRALDKNRLLDAFQLKFPTVMQMTLCEDLSSYIKRCGDQAEYYDSMGNNASKQADRDSYHKTRDYHMMMMRAYQFMAQATAFAVDEYANMKLNSSKNVEWKDLTSLEFFKYDHSTNSFVEVTEKG